MNEQSLTEFPAYWCERPELFAAIADGKTAEERSILVLKWFIVRSSLSLTGFCLELQG